MDNCYSEWHLLVVSIVTFAFTAALAFEIRFPKRALRAPFGLRQRWLMFKRKLMRQGMGGAGAIALHRRLADYHAALCKQIVDGKLWEHRRGVAEYLRLEAGLLEAQQLKSFQKSP